ncbi:MAG TPA: DUF4159 domain-containing protein [Planctomycetota bacterium]|nr:DUF4159 domain-containing protein [Planctomycetota bacterium]
MKIANAFLRGLGRLPVTLQLALPLAVFAALLWLTGSVARASLRELLLDDLKLLQVFRQHGIRDLIFSSSALAQNVALVYAAIAVLALIPRPTALFITRHAYIAVFSALIFFTYVVGSTIGVLGETKTAVDGLEPNADRQFAWYCKYLIPALVVGMLNARLLLNAYRGRTEFVYRKSPEDEPALGDVLIAWVNDQLAHRRTRSFGISLGLHFGILIFPVLMQLMGAVTPYLLPHGKGSPDAGGGAKKAATGNKNSKGEKEKNKSMKVRIAQKKPARTMKNMKGVIFSPDAGRNITATAHGEAMMEELDQLTELTYKADTNIVIGGTGTGTGGGTGPGNKAGGIGAGGIGPGGWPNGMKNSVIRFIRLEYNGPDWDDGMSNVANADVNFLNEFNKITGFKVATKGESHPVRFLSKYDKGVAPPFVFLTGSGGINMSPNDLKCLRDYLMDGGMLFADCGSPEWDRAFRGLIPSLLPGKQLVDISDDDVIFQAPFSFPNGAPPLWHHGGTRAMGVRHNGRWIVFYHPGDVNDAWKTGHSGLSPDKAKAAYNVGVNVLYYAFTKYLEAAAKHRP